MAFITLPDGQLDAVNEEDGSVTCLDPITKSSEIEISAAFVGLSGVMMWPSSSVVSVKALASAYFKRALPGKSSPACNVVVVYRGDHVAPIMFTNDDDIISWRGVECAQLVPRLVRR